MWENRWVVLVPGRPSWVEKRARKILREFDETRTFPFTIIPGKERYHAVVEEGYEQTEMELWLADGFSREVEEPVYAIEGRDMDPLVSRYLKGVESLVRQEAETLVRSVGCTVPWLDAPPPPPRKPAWATVVLIQGLTEAQVRQGLAKQFKHLRPEDFIITETPQGLLMRDVRGWLGMAMVHLSIRFPRATIYTVRCKPGLEKMDVSVSHKKQESQFVLPPGSGVKGFGSRDVTDILGERTPERILAALGIPQEWFQLRDDLPAGFAPKHQGS